MGNLNILNIGDNTMIRLATINSTQSTNTGPYNTLCKWVHSTPQYSTHTHTHSKNELFHPHWIPGRPDTYHSIHPGSSKLKKRSFVQVTSHLLLRMTSTMTPSSTGSLVINGTSVLSGLCLYSSSLSSRFPYGCSGNYVWEQYNHKYKPYYKYWSLTYDIVTICWSASFY